MIMRILLTAGVICLTSATGGDVRSVTTGTAGVEPRDLLGVLEKGYASAKSVLSDVRIVYVEEMAVSSDGETPAAPHHEAVSRCWAAYLQKSGREGVFTLGFDPESATEEMISDTILANTGGTAPYHLFDGRYYLDYLGPAGDEDVEAPRGRARYYAGTQGLLASGTGPVKFLGLRPRCMPDDVLRSPDVTVDTAPESVGGLLTYRIVAPVRVNQGSYLMSYWLCPERSCLPVRGELRDLNGSLLKRVETLDLILLDNGTWFAKEVVQKDYLPVLGQTAEIGTSRWVLKDIEQKPDVEEERIFNTSPSRLPTGVRVHDAVSGLQYFVNEGTISEHQIDAIVKETIGRVASDMPELWETDANRPRDVPVAGGAGSSFLPSHENIFAAGGPASSGPRQPGGPAAWLMMAGAGVLVGTILAFIVYTRWGGNHRYVGTGE